MNRIKIFIKALELGFALYGISCFMDKTKGFVNAMYYRKRPYKHYGTYSY